jgi:hypothetical protein
VPPHGVGPPPPVPLLLLLLELPPPAPLAEALAASVVVVVLALVVEEPADTPLVAEAVEAPPWLVVGPVSPVAVPVASPPAPVPPRRGS